MTCNPPIKEGPPLKVFLVASHKIIIFVFLVIFFITWYFLTLHLNFIELNCLPLQDNVLDILEHCEKMNLKCYPGGVLFLFFGTNLLVGST